ncbi:transcription factor Jun isoform X1 [Ictalurus punctatus]|uniref:Transcription factor Jun n=2 Tax=Ictalurus punctatus TaxID=7998 RepID=W5UFL3_ICTPU|nr:transcription factor Jun isoform X1 [Ictalurus punctatus]
MDGLFYNEALDGVLNQHHHHHHPHHHHHHHHGEAGGGNGYEALTRNMTLNLADAHDALTLTSPDLNLLKLTSPELERLIIQSCNGSAPTTPASGPARAFPAPKPAADEHDAFAALAEFQCQQRMSGNPDDVGPVAPGSSHACAGFAEHLNHTWDAYTDAPPPCVPAQFGAYKDEPQKVPETPPLSPIDMEDQERIKAERKRMRNRVAASKCRKRKLERLARLEERVSRLSGENGELRGAAETLRDQVAQLRHQLLDHIKSGCKLLSQQLQTVKEF